MIVICLGTDRTLWKTREINRPLGGRQGRPYKPTPPPKAWWRETFENLLFRRFQGRRNRGIFFSPPSQPYTKKKEADIDEEVGTKHANGDSVETLRNWFQAPPRGSMSAWVKTQRPNPLRPPPSCGGSLHALAQSYLEGTEVGTGL